VLASDCPENGGAGGVAYALLTRYACGCDVLSPEVETPQSTQTTKSTCLRSGASRACPRANLERIADPLHIYEPGSPEFSSGLLSIRVKVSAKKG
jgi:hypothetical protein